METFSQNQNATPTHPQKNGGKCFPFSLILFQVFSSCCRLHEIIIVFSSLTADSKTFNFLIALERDRALGE